MKPGFSSTEEESGLGEIEIWIGIGELETRDVELETTAMAEAEDVKGNDGSVVISDLGQANLCKRRYG